MNDTFIPLNDKDIDEKNLICKLVKGYDSENAFKISRITLEEKNNILFAKSALPYLLYFL